MPPRLGIEVIPRNGNSAMFDRIIDEIHHRNCYGYVRSVYARNEVRVVHAPLVMRHQINMMIRDINDTLAAMDTMGYVSEWRRNVLHADLRHAIGVRDALNGTISHAREFVESVADTRPNSPLDGPFEPLNPFP